MKPSFSFGDVLNAPFLLIRRRPLTIFVWGLAMVAMSAAIYAVLLPVFATMPVGDEMPVTGADAAAMMSLSLASNGLTILMYLLMLVVFNAAGRATLSPATRDRFLFMRLGMDEVRVAVTLIGVFFGWYVAFVLLVLIGAALVLAFWQVSEFVAVVTGLIYGLGVVVLSLFGWARVSLIAPATLVLGRFAFVEGWAIARGQVFRLVGLNLVIWVIYMLGYILLALVVAAILLGGFLAQGLVWPQDIERLADLMPIVRSMTAPLLITVPIFAFAYGAYIALVAAPFVRAARQLLDGAPVERPEAGRGVGDRLQTP